MRGPRLLLLSLACMSTVVGGTGCARYVVHVETDPGAAKVTLNGAAGRGDRWSVARESAAELVAVWPDGQRLATAMLIDRDMRVTLRKDGDPNLVVGARPLLAGPAAVPAAVPAAGPGAAPTPSANLPPPVALPINSPGGAAEGETMVRARGLAEAGQKAFELTDYDESIARFKEAYELIRSSKDPKAPEILGNILYNLAVVYEKSYEVTPEPERLRRARVMYRQFDEQMATLVKAWASSAEHADVLARIRALDARLGGK